jgi:hypothetical protein
MNIVPLAAFAFAALCGCASTPVRIPGENVRSTELPVSEIRAFLKAKKQAPVGSFILYQRDSVGSRLFMKFSFREGNEAAYRTLIVTAEGIREVPGYVLAWYDDSENPVVRVEDAREWYVDEGSSYRFYSDFKEASYIIKSGPAIPRNTASVGGVSGGDSGGDFVIVRPQDRPAFISTAEDPWQPLVELPEDVESAPSFATGDELIVFTTSRRGGFVFKCLIYQKSPDGYRLAKEMPLPWATQVYDFYPKTGDALIGGKSRVLGKFPFYYHFNIITKKRRRLGPAPAECLFLKEDVIRTLNAALQGAYSNTRTLSKPPCQ